MRAPSIQSLAVVALALLGPAGRAAVAAPVAQATAEPEDDHANPRLTLSYRRFSIAHLDGSGLWLEGAQLDLYPLSRRWIRAGIELEGGAGSTAITGNDM